MASITREVVIDAAPEAVWDAVRDVGALHERLVPGFVTGTLLVPDTPVPVRIVTFANGMVLHEPIVTIDDAQRRLVWTITGEGVDHHNGATQLFASGSGTRVTWIADVLPDTLAVPFGALMDEGMEVMRRHLAGTGAARH